MNGFMAARRAVRALAAACAGVVFCVACAADAGAQVARGAVRGTVVSAEDGRPIEGARVYLRDGRAAVLTDAAGRFVLTGLPAGRAELAADYIGRGAGARPVTIAAGDTVVVDLRLDVAPLAAGELVVTSTREAVRRAETPATVGVISSESIRDTRPSHPSEIMNRVAGVWFNVTGGEGHMAAIRQPKTTNPVYLYLEDGVPTRSTGFFNHNALYEVNVPQASRIEVLKGPASALYGSDAIGGTVNVQTDAPAADGLTGSVEGGSYGFGRVLASYGAVSGRNGVRTDLNLSRTDGWRDGTAYDRQSATVRWDRELGGGSTLKTVAAVSHIDQSTAGSSAISRDDYLNDPTVNYTPISYRRIKAFRLSTEYQRMGSSTLLTVTPFVRWNSMDILPNWSLTFDPGIWETGHASAGALVKVRRDFAPLRARLIAGADIDYSPGWHRERRIQPTRTEGIFVDYAEGEPVYDYDVAFRGLSPYVQAELSPVEQVRVTAGLRFDHLAYDYENALGELQTGAHRRPASTDVSYDHFSPKLGITYAPVPEASVFAAYGHGFRAPSEGQLFRQGRASNTVDLRPVKADNVEAGVRGVIAGRFRYDVSAYRMEKTDDILSLTNPDGSTESSNAGRTLHRGIEVGAGAALGAGVQVDVAWSVAEHTYEDWRPNASTDFSDNEMEDAPQQIGNVMLAWSPPAWRGSNFAVEWQRIGKYWMDAANTARYPGHDLLSVRATVPVTSSVSLFGRVSNITDERYAESAGYTVARGEEFAPGLPRAVYFGVEVR